VQKAQLEKKQDAYQFRIMASFHPYTSDIALIWNYALHCHVYCIWSYAVKVC